jgi:hypothetical protein
MAKHELYFSKYCKHSTQILDELNRSGLNDKFIYISIDKRFVKNNITYILNPNGTSFTLPPMINRVPVLLLKPNHEILSGNQILEYIKPQSKTINEEKTMLHSEPNPFSLQMDNGNVFGVKSDNYSYLDATPDELAAQGNGGVRQMYNYSTLDSAQTMQTPLQSDKQPKLNMTIEQIEQQRNLNVKK